MKLHALVFLIAFALFGESALAQPTLSNSAIGDPAVGQPALGAPAISTSAPEELTPPSEEWVVPPIDFESSAAAFGSPLTLMQWSYGNGADTNGLDRPLESDRPYFTKSASVVGRGNWQLEMGYTYADMDHGRSIQTFPEALLRIGVLAEWLEFRLGWTWVDGKWPGPGRYDSGSSDLSVGVKLALTPQDEMLPETALLIDGNLPESLFTSLDRRDMEPGVSYIYRWQVSDKLKMGGETGFRRIDLNRYQAPIQFMQTWIFERAITGALTGYAEFALFSLENQPETSEQHYVDGGLLYLVTDNVQLDASAGVGLGSRSADYFCGFGVTIRR